jgi:hypothetical protein
MNQPNKDEGDWTRAEEGYRYGDDKLEGKLKEEWGDMKSGRTWDEVKATVRRGWDRVSK